MNIEQKSEKKWGMYGLDRKIILELKATWFAFFRVKCGKANAQKKT